MNRGRTNVLQIVADANIIAADEAFGRYGNVRLLPGESIDNGALADADVLLVRSVTRVDPELLAGTPVRFVATATAGTDHLAIDELEALGIAWAGAPGSNADAVADYFVASILALAADRGEPLVGRTIGVVGVGHVGGRVAQRARALGLEPILCDPPRAELAELRGEPHDFVPLADALREADILTLHTPLTSSAQSRWPTRDMLADAEFEQMKPGAWLINAARGRVLNGDALHRALTSRQIAACALDVWPTEPDPDRALVKLVDIATPHVAGYSIDAKVRGTVAVERALRTWLASQGTALPTEWDPQPLLRQSAPKPLRLNAAPHPETSVEIVRALDDLARQARDVRAETNRFRTALLPSASPAARRNAFSDLRRTYPLAAEMSRYEVQGRMSLELQAAIERGLGMRMSP